MRTTLLAAAMLSTYPSNLPAQAPERPLTLAEALALARATSPELAAARQTVAAALGRERQADAFPNPVLGYGREQTSNDLTHNSQDVVSLEQTLDIFGQRSARRNAAELHRSAAEARLAAALGRVDYQVIRTYALARAATRRAALAEEAAGSFRRAVNVSRDRLAGGDISGYQHRRLRLEAARYTALELEARVARDSAIRTLRLLTGTDAGRLQLVDSLPPTALTIPVDSLVSRALENRAELRVANLDTQAAEAEMEVTRADRRPLPVVSAGYKTERVADGERLHGFIVGLSLGLPLWDRKGGAIEFAQGEAGRRAADLAALRRDTRAEVEAAVDAMVALNGELTGLLAELGEEAVRARGAAEAAYNEGEITLIEWLDAVRAYHEAETTYITLWSEYVTRRAELQQATGVLLF